VAAEIKFTAAAGNQTQPIQLVISHFWLIYLPDQSLKTNYRSVAFGTVVQMVSNARHAFLFLPQNCSERSVQCKLWNKKVSGHIKIRQLNCNCCL
jgi:hypothetical protein